MTSAEADRRIAKSLEARRRYSAAFEAGDLAGPMADYVRMIGAEVVILRQIAVEHRDRADEIAGLIGQYEALARHMRERMD